MFLPGQYPASAFASDICHLPSAICQALRCRRHIDNLGIGLLTTHGCQIASSQRTPLSGLPGPGAWNNGGCASATGRVVSGFQRKASYQGVARFVPTAHELGSCISDLFNHRFKMAFLCLLMRTNRRLPSQKRARARHYARNVAAHQFPSTGN